MKLRKTIIDRILTNSLSNRLADAMGFSQQWIKMCAKANKKDGPLTTATALAVIKKDMGILDDSEILEKVTDSVAA